MHELSTRAKALLVDRHLNAKCLRALARGEGIVIYAENINAVVSDMPPALSPEEDEIVRQHRAASTEGPRRKPVADTAVARIRAEMEKYRTPGVVSYGGVLCGYDDLDALFKRNEELKAAMKALADRTIEYVTLPESAADPQMECHVEMEALARTCLALLKPVATNG